MPRLPVALVSLSLLATGCAPELPRGEPVEPLAHFAADEAEVLARRPREIASYTLSASLDPQRHVLQGEGRIFLHNGSEVELDALWLHLYLNAFKNERSLFLREHRQGFRGQANDLQWGYIDLRSIEYQRADGSFAPLWPLPAEAPPQTGDAPVDETELRVPLAEPLAPGEDLELRVRWESKLPSVVLRTGFHERFHMVAQWFPKLAKLDAQGFTHFPFHHLSEFYADFGSYRVTVDVPDDYVIGATGERESERHEGGRTYATFVQHDVHDFAFTAWNGFQERSESVANGAESVDVRILYPAGHDAVAERELQTARFAIPHYGARYGRYPYRTLTIVHPPPGAEEAGGMEYPTLITTGGDRRTPSFFRGIELVTMHEFGHQYFYGLLASNEHHAPFLDEGLNSFGEIDSLERWLGPRATFDLGLLHLGVAEAHAIGARQAASDAAIDLPSDAFPTGRAYGSNVYSRTAALLESLRRTYGDVPFFETLGTYTRRYRFAHPTEQDLLDTFREGLGEQAYEFLRVGLHELGRLDVAVLETSTHKRREPRGLFDVPGGDREQRDASTSGADWLSTVVVVRRGSLALPVDVELRFADGSRKRLVWPVGERTRRFVEEHAHPLSAVVVDPERKLLVDDDRLNDSAITEHVRKPPRRAPLALSALFGLLGELL